MKSLWKWMIGLACGVQFISMPARAERQELDLSGPGWTLWHDQAAAWKDPELFLPPVDLAKIPANPPTGGWDTLTSSQGLAVSVPGTAEEYLSDGTGPKSAIKGVTWWSRTLHIPPATGSRRLLLRFESVRLRAEVYVNRKIAGYDVVGNTPFEADITDQVASNQDVQLAVRVTNPTGNYDWYDTIMEPWGKYKIPESHGFGGITGRVTLVSCDAVHVDNIYVQNTPAIREVNAHVTIRNPTSEVAHRNVLIRVVEKQNPSAEVFRQQLGDVSLPRGDTTIPVKVAVPNARLWDLDHPELYVCQVTLKSAETTTDTASQTFGFRWFAPEGQGANALFRLNGKRIVLRTAISWGFWPINGIYPTAELAERQILVAKQLGLNMLNFHRCIGNPLVLEKADEMGLLYYQEPGGYVAGGKDPFSQELAREKLLRMVKRDRSHPSLVLYNMINEGWPKYGAAGDEELFNVHLRDMRAAHTLDPSRTITYASAWARSTDKEEKPKLHMRPFDDQPRMLGWWDFHRAGGRECWREDFYRSPTDHYGYTANAQEIVYWGEDGAVSTPPRLGLIKKELDASPHPGWDGAIYLQWHDAFAGFMQRKNLTPAFPNVDDLCSAMGAVSLEHQGRKIEDHRICDANDGYAVNGWESQTQDNHSGIVDCFRNPKADPAIMAYYNQPLYVAVKTRNQVVHVGEPITVDFFAVNEKDLRGSHTLQVRVVNPTGQQVFAQSFPVTVTGGDVFGQLLKENVSIPIAGVPGFYRVEATLTDASGNEQARGHDQVFAVDWKGARMGGRGAVLELEGKVRDFLESSKNLKVPEYDNQLGPLDWIVVARSLKTEPMVIPSRYLRDRTGENPGLSATFYTGRDFREQLAQRVDEKIDFNWNGQIPDPAVKVSEQYCARWEGSLIPPVSGEYVLNTVSDDGVRLWIDGQQVIDAWKTAGAVLSNQAKVQLEAGKAVKIRLDYFQAEKSAEIHLRWIPPGIQPVDPAPLFARVQRDGTTLLLIDNPDTWMGPIQRYTAAKYTGQFGVGMLWVGGQYFVRDHPLFKELPTNVALNWPYQALLTGRRMGLNLEGEELVVGAYNTTPFHLGTSVGVIPYGKGRIIVSTLNILGQLSNPAGPAHVSRKLLCNFIEFAGNNSAMKK